MIHKYCIEAVEMHTGSKRTSDVECDGYIIMGLVREEDPKKRFGGMRVRIHGVGTEDIVNALYDEPKLRNAALLMAKAHKHLNNPIVRLFNWLRGESDEEE